ncbi:hypothetical protein HOLleu_12041 [Holothuria leucospilota]|uniref:Retrotransposon gag domain-containing protein n=1 Tax=Holothuria leucospilota TaxID=206669 RepID=A0A9Q1CAR9_HOLLE|nr:hypothetical protein HOLleu_12041 [Holothuria leucospilota]
MELMVEKLATVGAKLGLKGPELKQFIDEERKRIKLVRDKERAEALKERDRATEQRAQGKEHEEQMLEMKLKIEQARERQIELQASKDEKSETTSSGSKGQRSDGSKSLKLPAFVEGKDNMDAYLTRFERYATTKGWDITEWAVNLSTLLTGKGLMTYYSFSDDEAKDFEKLKTALLRRYEHTEEGFRNKFRNSKPESGETAGQFVTRMKTYLNRWIKLS